MIYTKEEWIWDDTSVPENGFRNPNISNMAIHKEQMIIKRRMEWSALFSDKLISNRSKV